mmetsp:Transcript_132105/g.229004  ORF Transcript_132105/g.229004 Transcript_132105/m.229004 type:complete len:118 (+) Transcript_132105:104-457(+)
MQSTVANNLHVNLPTAGPSVASPGPSPSWIHIQNPLSFFISQHLPTPHPPLPTPLIKTQTRNAMLQVITRSTKSQIDSHRLVPSSSLSLPSNGPGCNVAGRRGLWPPQLPTFPAPIS